VWWHAGASNAIGGAAYKNPFVMWDPSDNSHATLLASGQDSVYQVGNLQPYTTAVNGNGDWALSGEGMSLFFARDLAVSPDGTQFTVVDSDWTGFRPNDAQAALPAHDATSTRHTTSPTITMGLAIAYDPSVTATTGICAIAGCTPKYSNTGGDVGVITGLNGTSGWVTGGLKGQAGYPGNATIGLYIGRDAAGKPFILAASQGAGIWRWQGATASSVPAAGSTWAQQDTAISSQSAAPPGPFLRITGDSAGNIYALDKLQGVYRNTNYGIGAWTKIGTCHANGHGAWNGDLTTDNAGNLWVCCDPVTSGDSGLYKVTTPSSGSISFPGSAVNNLPGSGVCGPIACNPANGHVYACSLGVAGSVLSQLWATSNGGTSWASAGDSSFAQVAYNPRCMRFAQSRLFLGLDTLVAAFGVPSA
jgi:hypothetical protein